MLFLNFLDKQQYEKNCVQFYCYVLVHFKRNGDSYVAKHWFILNRKHGMPQWNIHWILWKN